MDGWIKLYRKIKKSAIWKTSNSKQKVVLVTLMTMANYEENEWIWKGKKFKVKSGQFVTSLESIKEECEDKDVTVQVVRTALDKFEKYNFLTNESTSTGRLITIVNWGLYQDNEVDTQQRCQQRPNKDLTTNKKERKERNNIYSQIIDYLNEKTCRTGRSKFSCNTKDTVKRINARIKEGATIEDFKIVIDNQCLQWLGTSLAKYLTPDTLFSPSKFEKYLKSVESVKEENTVSDRYID